VRRLVTALWIATGVIMIAFLASTVLRTSGTHSRFWDEWVGNLGYGGCTLLCAIRALTRREQRGAWAAIALSLAIFTVGSILWTTTVQFWDPVPYPSIADAFFLVFYPVAYLGVGLLARVAVPRASTAVWTDGLIAAFGVAALEAAIVIGSISSGNRGDAATVATNLVYPIGDLVLLMMVVGVFAILGWRPGPMWWALGVGLVVFAAADSVYVLRVSDGTYVTGEWLDGLWLVGGFLIASAAWVRARPPAPPRDGPASMVVPGLFLCTSLAIVLYGSWGDLLPLAGALAAVALLLALARMAQAHRQLGLLAAQARDLLEAAPEAMVCVAADGVVALSNAQAAALFGYDGDQLAGRPVEALLPDWDAGAGAGVGVEPQRARRHDGGTFPAEISRSTIETPDGVLTSLVVRDISQRLAAQAEREELLAQAERDRMEGLMHQSRRLEALGQLAGGIAHDFNNLLAAIRSYSSFVATEVAGAAARDGAERWQAVVDDVAEIDRDTERAARLTRQLLAFARRDVTRPEELWLNTVVTEVEQLLRRTIGDHVQLVTELDDRVWPVRADPGQLEQVLVNLAVNARDAMPGGGRLVIRTDALALDEACVEHGLAPGRYARLQVVDTGTGMDEATLAHAFEPFFSTKPPEEGTGLGLATVYGIISQAGGRASVESAPGRGTTVTVLLPATDDAPTERAAVRRAVAGGKGETVLVVEDNGPMREAARRILAREGYVVVAAADGPEAIERAGGHDGPIDVLLTDVNMPGMAGTEVARRIQEARPATKVIYMSGYTAGAVDLTKGLAPGLILIEKPFDPSQLLETVRAVLDT